MEIAGLLAAQFAEQRNCRGCFVVAIDGPGCCGKSSLADEILGYADDAAQLATDDFHMPRGSTPDSQGPLPYRRWAEFVQMVQRLVAGHEATFRPIDWKCRRLSAEVSVRPAPLLVIEGIGALHPDLAALVDYRIWVDGRADTRMERVRIRDGDSEVPNWHKYVAFEQRYLETFRPWSSADLWVFGADLAGNASLSFSCRIDALGKALVAEP